MFQYLHKFRYVVLSAVALLMLLPAGAMPLMETTEARYAEIAREMISSGNFLEPTFNAIKHFHKPPLSYWLVAAGFKLFGLNNFGARFFGVLAAVLAIVYVYRTACLFLDKEKGALIAALIFGSTILFVTVAHLASTEIYLTTCVVAAQFYLLRQAYENRSRRNALLFGLWLGLGFAIKGPIIFLFTLLPALLVKPVDSSHRHLFSWRELFVVCTLFAMLALPWYLWVSAANPGLLGYFLKVQTLDRVVTDRFHRYEPPWYFFYIFVLTFFPYTLFFLKGLRHWKRLPRRFRILFFYIAAPLLVFTLAKGKHATYILPFYGICAILTSRMLQQDRMPALRTATAAILLIPALAPSIAGSIYPVLTDSLILLLPGTLLLVGVWYLLWKNRGEESFWAWTALFMLLFSGVSLVTVGAAGPDMRGYQQMTAAINRQDPQRQLETLVYHGFLPSISFYRNKLAVMADHDQRETRFQSEGSYRRWYLNTNNELEDFLTRTPELFVVVRKRNIAEFTSNHPYQCEEIFTQRKHSAYLCRRLPAAEQDITESCHIMECSMFPEK